MEFDFDLFVIGGGSGGVRAARVAAAEAGARVGLAEMDRYGGTCVIRGCVPKKLMVFASGFSALPAEAAAYGWEMQLSAHDWPGFHKRLVAELDRLEGIYRKVLADAGVRTFDTRARIVDPHRVALATGEEVTAKHILVATGGRPTRPDKPGVELGIVSDDIFHLERLPKRALIVGGGYIACEFSCILNGLGVEVTQYYRGAQILRGFDGEARGLVAEAMRHSGIDLHTGTDIVEMGPADEPHPPMPTSSDPVMGVPIRRPHGTERRGPIWVKATNGDERVFDTVLFATGRLPNTEGLGLEDIGVELGRKGEVVVDRFSQTSVPSIFAIGDVTDRLNLTPVAIREAMCFVETVFKGNPTPVDHEAVASAVFTQPEFGTVGLSEEEAAEQEAIEVYCTSFRPMRTAFAGRPDRVMMKLVVSRASRRVLGCHIVAPGAGELIQLAAVAVKMGATKEDFDRTIAVHPTMAEELVLMRTPVRTA